MRIITGKARGTHLATLEGDATRPTAERTKEALFSMLGSFPCEARVLDLFAGSGQLGLEALSRGAANAVFCDSSRRAMDVVRANAERTHLSSLCSFYVSDAAALLSRLAGKQRFDLVFLDPPYADGCIPRILAALQRGDLLFADARVICETAKEEDVFEKDATLADAFDVLRVARYGAACLTVLTPRKDPAVSEGEGEKR